MSVKKLQMGRFYPKYWYFCSCLYVYYVMCMDVKGGGRGVKFVLWVYGGWGDYYDEKKNIRVRYWGLLTLGDRRTRIMNDLYQVNTNKLSTNLYVIRDMPWIPRELQRALKLSHLNTILYSKNSISSSPYFTKNI